VRSQTWVNYYLNKYISINSYIYNLLKFVGNSPNVSQSFTLDITNKVKHCIRIKTHNFITLKFFNKYSVKYFICVKLMSYI